MLESIRMYFFPTEAEKQAQSKVVEDAYATAKKTAEVVAIVAVVGGVGYIGYRIATDD